MSYRLRVRPRALAETKAIVEYEQQGSVKRAERFLRELENCNRYAEQNPFGFQVRFKHYRHAMVKGFRYRIVFAIVRDTVQVYQIRHTSRKPSKRFGP